NVATTQPDPCHLDQRPRSLATEEKWRDPDKVSPAMLIQGVFFKMPECYPPRSMRDGFHYKFWVYILSSRSGTLYVDLTGYVERSIYQHNCTSVTRTCWWPSRVRSNSSAGGGKRRLP